MHTALIIDHQRSGFIQEQLTKFSVKQLPIHVAMYVALILLIIANYFAYLINNICFN